MNKRGPLHPPFSWGICPRCGLSEPDTLLVPCLTDAEVIERREKQFEAEKAAEAFERVKRNG